MLLEYGVKNFFSFKEGAVVDLRFDGNTPEDISGSLPAATIAGFSGANAAGKTHLLKALNFLRWFAAESFDWKPDAAMPIESYGGSAEASEFFLEFSIGSVTYVYEIEVTEREVVRETLYRTRTKRTLVFERVGNQIARTTKEFSSLNSLKLRSNVSTISMANQYQLEILKDVHQFFVNVYTNVSYGGLHAPVFDMNEMSRLLSESPNAHRFVEEFIKSCDTGVSRIDLLKREGEKGEAVYFPAFIHEIEGREYHVSSFEESSGTKQLFLTLAHYFSTLTTGGILVVDEIDQHLHPHILPKLVSLFTDPALNKKNAQLLFTSHDTRIMDTLGRYRTFIVNKRENESFVFRLDEVPGDLLRNDRPISPIYEDGKVGGVPRV
ncbi:AAA family ATPase [Caballeronia sp. LZ034LL]|uniref:AAA family ATPase n=1 Tax=Caballeronia sp. LZ034LL TaxID=3038567 RepID=UPI00285A964D|nr:AAA family ATPase [Caballeronia sp. LZ034LL]MDR5837442.1 AAA family ATPase [Caballeronia sp. LZ034LL]